MQIKNITAQYEYEVEDASSLYNKAYSEVQEEMIQDLINERTRLKNVHKQAMQANKRRGNDDEGNYLSNANQLISKSLASMAPTVPLLNLAGAAAGGNGATNGTGTRSLRSTAVAEPSAGEYVSADSKLEQLFNRNNSGNGRDIKDNVSVSGGSTLGAAAALLGSATARRKKIPNTSNGSLPLDQVLSESSMRADFLEIVRDLQSRAEAFERTKPKSTTKEVSLNGDYSELTVGSDVYTIGECVNVFSVLSQETLSGVITAISHAEIIVRLGAANTSGGARVSFTLGHLKSGRVVLSKDNDTAEQNELLLQRGGVANGGVRPGSGGSSSTAARPAGNGLRTQLHFSVLPPQIRA